MGKEGKIQYQCQGQGQNQIRFRNQIRFQNRIRFPDIIIENIRLVMATMLKKVKDIIIIIRRPIGPTE